MILALLDWSFSAQVAFNGLAIGLGYSVIAAGIVLIYRSSGIVNFAQAAIGAFGVASFVVLFQNYDLPYPLAMALGVAGAVAIGVLTELLVVRRLFDAPRVVLLIATVGVAQLVTVLIVEALPDVQGGVIPVAFDATWAEIQVSDGLTIGPRQSSLILLIVPVVVALGFFLSRTRLGLHIRAVADSPENARLVGVSPKRVSTLVWGLAAGFAAYTQIALAPVVTRTADDLAGVSTIGLLLRALIVAMAARMRSIPIVILGGLALGMTESIVSVNLNRNIGVFNAFLFVGVLVLVLLLARAGTRQETGFTVGARRAPIPDRLQRNRWIGRLPGIGMLLFLVPALVVPQVVTKSSELLIWTELLIVAMVAVSLSLLTGWAGQLSLGQFAFAGVGGLSMIAFTQGHTLGIGAPWVGQLTEVTIELPWLAALVAATAVGIGFAVLVGLPALRVKGLFLAVTTLAFANMASNWMFAREFWSGGRPSVPSVTRDRPVLGGVDFGEPSNYYYLCLVFLVGVVLLVSRLRRTGAGRTMIAVRDNEPMTSAATVSPTRTKLSAFAVSGGIAALAGALYSYLLPGFLASGSESPFSPEASLQLVAIAIIGGIGTVAGGILGALWVVGLPAAFGANDTVRLLSANVGLLLLLLYFPGGLVQVIYNVRDFVVSWLGRRVPREVAEPAATPHLTTRERLVALPEGDRPWLEARDVTVTFGGVRAVADASIEVHRGEVVGLIGTNGAGKSTLMNAISGFTPHGGTIRLLDHDVTNRSAHRRHAAGLGRGFQDARLFGGLTVRETVLVALEARQHSLLVPSMLALPPSPSSERRKRTEADEILTFLGLGPYADHFAADLSTGTRRVAELACLIATDAKVLLLDEPTAGMAQRETEAFAPLIRQVQHDLDAALVVIEHDMPLIMRISDRVYCMEAGRVIAAGTPSEVRSDPAVIASYLGTDERAIARSGQGGATTETTEGARA
ncbi:MAG TPA: branched-chain amino acid ABC transporter permease/ATP-binding protein [Acidimicrobiales bacterium]|nr:branched-chain amino acid ABC transporter permease/ATP-binding protein [Acidimicrobiales bacterium]